MSQYSSISTNYKYPMTPVIPYVSKKLGTMKIEFFIFEHLIRMLSTRGIQICHKTKIDQNSYHADFYLHCLIYEKFSRDVLCGSVGAYFCYARRKVARVEKWHTAVFVEDHTQTGKKSHFIYNLIRPQRISTYKNLN